MKKHILTVAAAALLSIPTYTIAQDKPAGDKPAGDKPAGERPARPGGGRGSFTPEDRVKRLTEALGLTQEQQDKVKAIYTKGADEMKALREKGRENLTDEDKAKMGEFMKKQQEEIAAILTPEQKEKMKNLPRGGGPGGRPGGAPGGDRKPGEGKPEEKK